MPNVTAFQRADRLALLEAIDSFFALLGELPTNEEATKLAFTIRRCEYKGEPADVKTLMYLLGWKKTKVLLHLKEVHEFFEFRTEKDPLDNRRSVQRLHGIESPATTAFFEKCLHVVDVLVEAREEAKKLRTEADQVVAPPAEVLCAPRRRNLLTARPLKAAATIAAAVLLTGWAVFDTDKMDDLDRWKEALWEEVIEDPVEQFLNDPDHRARDTTVRFATAEKMPGRV